MFVSRGFMGAAFDYSNPFAKNPYQTPVAEAPIEVLKRFPGLVSAQTPVDQEYIAQRLEADRKRNMLLYGGIALGALALYLAR